MGFLSGLPHRGDAGAVMGDLDEGIGGGHAVLLLTTACESTVTSMLKVLFFLNKT